MTFTHRIATVLTALAMAVVSAPAAAGHINSIVFFGDSLSDTGNVWYATGGPSGGFPPPPYNQGSGGAGPDFTGGQWSDPLGPSWPTVFAARFGLFATPSLVGGNNYAWGGARTGTNPDFPASGGVAYLDQQVGLYGLSIASGGPAPTAHTLASVVIGGNDVANNLGNADAVTAGISSLTTQLSSLYGLGVRQFLVANVPDIGATPRFQELGEDTAAFATAWTAVWNDALAAALDTLVLPGADLYFLDFFSFGRNPEVLAGFANTTDACLTSTVCDDPASYFYWDSFHPSSTAHALIARQAFAAVPEPGTIALLMLGFAGLALCTRGRQGRRATVSRASSGRHR